MLLCNPLAPLPCLYHCIHKPPWWIRMLKKPVLKLASLPNHCLCSVYWLDGKYLTSSFLTLWYWTLTLTIQCRFHLRCGKNVSYILHLPWRLFKYQLARPFCFCVMISFSYSQFESTEVLLLCETVLCGLKCILIVLLITDVDNFQVGWSQVRKWENKCCQQEEWEQTKVKSEEMVSF